MAKVSLSKVEKFYGDTKVVHGVDLEIDDNEFVVLVGPSGCGKSTLLRMIAGLEDISAGTIAIDGRTINELEPKDRDIAMVFQDYALYPHLTVRQNIGFGLEMRKLPKAEIARQVDAAAAILNIGELMERRPRQLSGGQRQRVAMGRAIVRNPKVFLFDEPLSNLDAKLRVQMRTEIKKLHARVRTTMVYVTHDQVEAMTLADRIVVLRSGVIEQIGTPAQVYDRPVSMFVAGFIGAPAMNFLEVAVEGEGARLRLGDGTALAVPEARRAAYRGHSGRKAVLGLRPEHILPGSAERPDGAAFSPPVEVVEPLGSDTLVFFRVGAEEAVARLPPEAPARPGQPMPLLADMGRMHLFDPVSQRVIAP
ncbi:MAG: sn-glycerol-3-phosphate ABC transporter ATP-binding protein UgpC [Alphaproteobacteria bacterium]|nr:sn-glycerol-3-phosphate ABC transporter ATP-binding protein UgpC [Alphaproteobacteria bacterium]